MRSRYCLPPSQGLVGVGVLILLALFVLLDFPTTEHSRSRVVPLAVPEKYKSTPALQRDTQFASPKVANGDPQLVATYGRLPLAFEANQGQTDSSVKFLSRGRGYSLFLTCDEAVLTLHSRKPQRNTGRDRQKRGRPVPSLLPTADSLLPSIQSPQSSSELRFPRSEFPIRSNQNPAPGVLRMKLVGANEHAKVTGLGRLTGKSNYFVGNDPKKWRTNVANYSRVKYQDVYPGIDLVYYGNQGHLEYDFVVSPGADPRAIAFEIDGADRAVRESPTRAHRDAHLRIDPAGDLVIATDDGDVRLHKPVVYQPTIDKLQSTTDALNPKSKIANPKYLDGRFILAVNNQVTFEVGSYDKTLPLVIDPVLSYSTFLGGSGGDSADGIAVDASGNAYVTGSTSSVEFPTVAGSFDTSCGTDGNCNLNAPFGGGDIFVTKLNAAGTALVYSTYLGGSDRDTADGIAVDSSGNAYLSGTTQSADFPTTGGAFRTAFAGGFEDAFVTKLNAAGTALVYSTYLGGSEQDEANCIAVGSSGNVYLSGTTSSTNFPTSGGVLQPACVPGNLGQCNDAFVAKVNTAATGSASLVYSTFLGGSEIDFGGAIAVDTSGNAYIAAATHSPDFPVRNPFQPNNRGGIDAYVTKLNATGSGLIYSTYLGGGADDYAFGIAVDSTGNIYVSGRTDSDNFPATPGAFQTACAGGSGGSCQDAFVAKLNPAGSSLIYSTFLGGSDNEESFSGMAIDSLGNSYVSG